MTIAISGAFGCVGQGTIKYLLSQNENLILLDQDNKINRKWKKRFIRFAKKSGKQIQVFLGDIRDQVYLERSINETDSFIHLAALIPPAADRLPDLARSINIEGTQAALSACESLQKAPRFILASSISVYGDRLAAPWIAVTDQPDVNGDDVYAASKLEAEALVQKAHLRTAILRLSYVVDPHHLKMDPLFFHVPLATRLELLHRDDAGKAFGNAALSGAADGLTLNIGGGGKCRTDYRAYLERMFRYFGFGAFRLPEHAFATEGFHCGWYADSDHADNLLKFRNIDLGQIYQQVDKLTRFRRAPIRLIRKLAEKYLIRQSRFAQS